MTFPPARRAKIVCTLGPATRSAESIAALIEAGMDLARLNLSRGTHDEHRAAYERVRSASDAAKRAVAVLADLQGPKIRLGTFRGGSAELTAGAEFTITAGAIQGGSRAASTTYRAPASGARPRGPPLLARAGPPPPARPLHQPAAPCP